MERSLADSSLRPRCTAYGGALEEVQAGLHSQNHTGRLRSEAGEEGHTPYSQAPEQCLLPYGALPLHGQILDCFNLVSFAGLILATPLDSPAITKVHGCPGGDCWP